MAKFSTQFLVLQLRISKECYGCTTLARPRQMAQQRMMAGIDTNTPVG